MIGKNKTYRTRGGRDVRIYATDGNGVYPVHGASKDEEGWALREWTMTGAWRNSGSHGDGLDLIEVKPRIVRDVWVNLYDQCLAWGFHLSRDEADRHAHPDRIGCVKLTIDCEHGHGLDVMSGDAARGSDE